MDAENPIPPIPADPAGAFTWVLTHIIGLDTVAKRARISQRGGVITARDLIMVDMDQLLNELTENTTVMSKTKLQTLKIWAEEQFDTHGEIHLADFTHDVCTTYQLKYSRSKDKTKTKTDTPSTTKEKLRHFNGKNDAATTERLYTFAGKEFGPDEHGKAMLIVRALYGLKSSGAAYRAHFANTLVEMGFKSCMADPDVWYRPARKPDGFEYYEYILTYVDDCLVVSHDTQSIIEQLQNEYGYRLKDIGKPTRYLGAQIGQYQFDDGSKAWYMSAQLYLQQAIGEIEQTWGPLNKLFADRSKLDTPLPPGIHPELDDSPMLDEDDTQLYQSYVGVLRWAVELGHIDIAHSAGVMARFSAAPRNGHMYYVLRILAYCKKHIESKIVFDTLERDFDDMVWADEDWKLFYPDIDGEVLPPNRPQPLGNPVQINMFCDAAHATCHLTRRSTTGIILFINGAPIQWYSKRQNTIESSVFGSEFVALKIASELNEALRYKLRMMGIPISEPTNTFCDNKSVVVNATIPQSTLQKKHNFVAYHKVRESVASRALRISHEQGKFNMSDSLTKFQKTPDFIRCIRCILMR